MSKDDDQKRGRDLDKIKNIEDRVSKLRNTASDRYQSELTEDLAEFDRAGGGLSEHAGLSAAKGALSTAADELHKLNEKHEIGGRSRRFLSQPLVQRYMPIASWLGNYKNEDFSGDLTAGIIVAIMLIPQGMAYALLAGLPPQMGLYASIAPLLFYALFGTSRTLAVGPVAIVSLMVASALSSMVAPGSPEYAAYAILLALLSGIFLVLLGLLRIGFLVNFMSHPVISGFTSAAALIIGFSQFKHLLGLKLERTHFIPELLMNAYEKFGQINVATATIAGVSVLMLLSREHIAGFMKNRDWIGDKTRELLPKAMPLVVVILGVLATVVLGLSEKAGVKIVGAVPAGLPPLTIPTFDWALWKELLPTAVLISIVGFLESVSVAKSLASKRRQKVIPNQELVGLGAANIGAALTGGYPVTGGFSRSVVNFSAGANTPLASIITAGIIAVVLLFLTPLLYYLPKAVLAAIIIVAVATLVDFKSLVHAWKYNLADGLSYLGTFVAVLVFGVEIGIIIGISISIGLFLYRTSRPHTAIVGRVKDSEHFRNTERHFVETYDDLHLVRIDESLLFANTTYLEDQILQQVADRPKVKHLVLIFSAVNLVDASALETLEELVVRLRDAGVTLHLAEVKGPVMDMFRLVDFDQFLEPGQIFLSTHEAVERLENA